MKRRVGLEFEYPVIRKDGKPVLQKEINRLFNFFASKKWTKKKDRYTKQIIGVYKKTKHGTFMIDNDGSPGILEIGTPPHYDLFSLKKEQEGIMKHIFSFLKKTHSLLGYGVSPFTDPHDLTIAPKGHYPHMVTIVDDFELFRPYYILSSTQTNISGSLPELLKAANVFFALSGPLVSISANISVYNGKILPFRDARGSFADNFKKKVRRTYIDAVGIPNKPFVSWKEYMTFLFDRPGHLLLIDGEFYAVHDHKTHLLDALKNKKPILVQRLKKTTDKKKPKREKKVLKIQDLWLMQAILWTDIRLKFSFKESIKTEEFLQALESDEKTFETYLKKNFSNYYIEIRPVTTQPKNEQYAMPAFCLGLMEELHKVEKIIYKHDWTVWKKMRVAGYKKGLQAKVKNIEAKKLLKKLLAISKKGLKKRGYGEEIFLSPLYKRLKQQITPSEKAEKILREEGKDAFLDYLTL